MGICHSVAIVIEQDHGYREGIAAERDRLIHTITSAAKDSARAGCYVPERIVKFAGSMVSPLLQGGKGGFFVIAGTFNGWQREDLKDFCVRLSEALDARVAWMHSNDEEDAPRFVVDERQDRQQRVFERQITEGGGFKP